MIISNSDDEGAGITLDGSRAIPETHSKSLRALNVFLEKEELSSKINDVPLSLIIRIENEENDEGTPLNTHSNIRLASCPG